MGSHLVAEAPSFIFQSRKLRLCRGGIEGDQNQGPLLLRLGRLGAGFGSAPPSHNRPPWVTLISQLVPWGLGERVQRAQHGQGWAHSRARDQLVLVLSR